LPDRLVAQLLHQRRLTSADFSRNAIRPLLPDLSDNDLSDNGVWPHYFTSAVPR